MSLFDTGVRPAIDAWLLAKSKEKRDYGEYWSASSAGHCQRRVIFERLGVPHIERPEDARKQRVFTAGHLFHEWIQGITKEAGVSIAQEVELQDEELMIRGHFDDLVLIKRPVIEPFEEVKELVEPKTHDHLILYDYKTQNSRAFSYKRPMSHFHKLQLGTYMYMLRRVSAPLGVSKRLLQDLTEARILKIDKDTLRMQEEQLLWSDELSSEVRDYWTSLNKYWKERKLPKCTCADQEGGFMANEKWNPYFKDGEPCSIKVYQEWKKGKR